jgi:hypothetical protein
VGISYTVNSSPIYYEESGGVQASAEHEGPNLPVEEPAHVANVKDTYFNPTPDADSPSRTLVAGLSSTGSSMRSSTAAGALGYVEKLFLFPIASSMYH